MPVRHAFSIARALFWICMAGAVPAALQAQTQPLQPPPERLLPPVPPPLAGTTSISNLEVKQGKGGMWYADFDYFFIGAPRDVRVRVDVATGRAQNDQERFVRGPISVAQRGTHHLSIALQHPGEARTSYKITVSLLGPPPDNAVLAKSEMAKLIEWPTYSTWLLGKQMAQRTPQESLDEAVRLIDTGNEARTNEAKAILEWLLTENPKMDAAYVELARVAMRTNWGPEGLHQAETLLDSALQLAPESINAKVLLGYVYTNQRRYPEAEKLFVSSAKANPPNLWLWVNWGDLLAVRGETAQAIQKYREAITRPMTHDTYDRARSMAYERLLKIYEQRNGLDDMETLYKQRIAEFGHGSCYSADYSRFLLQRRDDPDGAIDVARKALGQNCEDSESREILGLASYAKWATAKTPDRILFLNQARIYLPASAKALYLLATGERTVPAARELISAGENIDQLDNQKYTALAQALKDNDLDAVRRLIQLGAKTNVIVGFEQIPVALLPVMDGNLDAVRMLRKAGVDYSTLRFRGATAIEFAQQSGDSALLEALGDSKVRL